MYFKTRYKRTIKNTATKLPNPVINEPLKTLLQNCQTPYFSDEEFYRP
jgi:hypothetical protein